jgi:hypothetical protein
MTTKTVTEFDPMTQADGVANLLGREWTVRTGDWSGSRILAHPGGYRVRLYAGAGDGRLHIAGLLPAPIDEEHLRPDTADLKPGDITVALTSPPQRVAGEITRRLLPGLAEATRTYLERRADLAAAEQARTWAAERIAAVPGVSAPMRTTWRSRTETAWHLSWDGPAVRESYPPRPSAQVEVDADRTTAGVKVNVELRGLTVDQAEAVLRVLTEGAS